MNYQYSSSGNPFKLTFRKHYCYKCDKPLKITQYEKYVERKSKESKKYDFTFGDVTMVGGCTFVRDIFYCRNCEERIEIPTQISYEDIAIIATKVEKYFFKKMGKNIIIARQIITSPKHSDNVDIGEIGGLYLKISGDVVDNLTYDAEVRDGSFVVKKRELIKFIKKHLR